MFSTMRTILVILCFLIVGSLQLAAQTTIKNMDKGKTEKANQRIWFGGNVPLSLGFGSSTLIQFGLSPMLGYKITPDFSIGPRVGFLYSYYSQRLVNGQVESVQPLSWTAGVFSRYKFVDRFFAHLEYEYENEAVPYYTSNGFEVQRYDANNLHIGLGLLQGGGGGAMRSEILLLYNVNPSPFSSQSPISLRFGLNWHF